jgi:NAD(P)-dependent dehydrogenase (short-subunit alcohol dehydrogenase family)
MGFRNVCATDVFVGHVGTRSFLDEKRSLVVRNLAILNDRFPGHEIDCAAFLKADPLAPARARLEEWLTPVGPVVLLIAPAASGRLLALERAFQLDDSGDGPHCIHCEFDNTSGCITIRSVRGVAPQSLSFALAEPSTLERLQDYLNRVRPKSIELFAAHALPDAILSLAYALDVPVRLAVGDLEWMCDREFVFGRSCPDSAFPGQCDVCALPPALTASGDERSRTDSRRRTRVALAKAEAVIPLDRMAAAFCATNLTSLKILRCAARSDETANAVSASPGQAVLGAISPEATPDTDRQVLARDRQFERQRINASIVVLGRSLRDLEIMERGRIFVTGAISDDVPDSALWPDRSRREKPAGFGFIGAIEEATPDEYRPMFETNIIGLLETTRAALPALRKAGPGGRIVNMSSGAGIKGLQGSGHYNATKFAVEGISEALAQEVAPFGIAVIIVEPGPFRTDFLGRSISLAKKEMPEYAGTAGVFRTFRANNDGKQVGDPNKAVKVILKAVDAEKPPLHLPLGARAYALARTKIAEFTQDIDAWEQVAKATDYA